ncbi:MAG: hypothetical protein JKX87_07370 [Cycloclasticus sp.]|nr:hypothetical protein [Cycloclasticus sp.]
MIDNKMLPISFVVLFVMLGLIWRPSFSNLGDLFGYAESAKYKGVSLLDFFKAELVIIVTVWTVLLTYKRRGVITDGDYLVKKQIMLVVFVIGQVFMGFFAGGFLVHQDASWYQVLHENSEIMPAQAIILLICYPSYIFFGGSAAIYAKTRLPHFFKDKYVAFMVLTFAPLAFLPYYDGSLLEAKREMLELVYMLVYWLLSVAWVVLGVLYIIFKSSQDIFKGLSDPFSEM